MHARIITASAAISANVAAGVVTPLVFHTGATTFEVPTDFALMVTMLSASLGSGGMAFELTERDVSGNAERVYRIAASSAGQNPMPPITFGSGSRVTIDVTNIATVVGGAVAAYTAYCVLVPSVDFDETKYPENIPPYFPRPW